MKSIGALVLVVVLVLAAFVGIMSLSGQSRYDAAVQTATAQAPYHPPIPPTPVPQVNSQSVTVNCPTILIAGDCNPNVYQNNTGSQVLGAGNANSGTGAGTTNNTYNTSQTVCGNTAAIAVFNVNTGATDCIVPSTLVPTNP